MNNKIQTTIIILVIILSVVAGATVEQSLEIVQQVLEWISQ